MLEGFEFPMGRLRYSNGRADFLGQRSIVNEYGIRPADLEPEAFRQKYHP
jgi:hypothetical protein